MIGIIGGSGLEKPDLFSETKTVFLDTPYGKPAAPVRIGEIANQEVVLVSRHGFHHEFTPTHVPYQANLWTLKELGVQHVLAASACGSLRDEITPGDLVIPNQLIDFTKHRPHSFNHQKGVNAHTPFGEPFCSHQNDWLAQSCRELGLTVHANKTVITIEGPRFSSRAESHMFRNLGADIINMTTATEATLARELGLCYSVLAMATDYDCWKTDTPQVTIETVLQTIKQNSHHALAVFKHALPKITEHRH